jgi:hypothetical protein
MEGPLPLGSVSHIPQFHREERGCFVGPSTEAEDGKGDKERCPNVMSLVDILQTIRFV